MPFEIYNAVWGYVNLDGISDCGFKRIHFLYNNAILGLYSLSGKTCYHQIKSRSRDIWCYNDRNALKFDRHLDSAAAEVPVKFQRRLTT